MMTIASGGRWAVDWAEYRLRRHHLPTSPPSRDILGHRYKTPAGLLYMVSAQAYCHLTHILNLSDS